MGWINDAKMNGPTGCGCRWTRRNLLVISALFCLAGCGGTSGEAGADPGLILEGQASYYAHKFHGRPTASGEIYDENKMTAAHRTLPFGTTVRVTNLANGKKAVVRINDRGPFIEGRIIDLSYRAAGELDFITRGVVEVRVEVLRADGNF